MENFNQILTNSASGDSTIPLHAKIFQDGTANPHMILPGNSSKISSSSQQSINSALNLLIKKENIENIIKKIYERKRKPDKKFQRNERKCNIKQVKKRSIQKDQIKSTIPHDVLHNQSNSTTSDNKFISSDPVIQSIYDRLKVAKTQDERKIIFREIKRIPHLFAAFLKVYGGQNSAAAAKIRDATYVQPSSTLTFNNPQSTIDPMIQAIYERLKAANSKDERQIIFKDLKKTPHLFAAFLKAYSAPSAIKNN